MVLPKCLVVNSIYSKFLLCGVIFTTFFKLFLCAPQNVIHKGNKINYRILYLPWEVVNKLFDTLTIKFNKSNGITSVVQKRIITHLQDLYNLFYFENQFLRIYNFETKIERSNPFFLTLTLCYFGIIDIIMA